MLTPLKMWNIIKQRFGVPYTFFELDVDQVIQYIRDYTMPYFSQYVPTKVYVYMDHTNLKSDPAGQQSVFEIPYDGTIVTVVDVLQDANRIITGHPITPILSGSVVDKIIAIQESNVRWKMSTSLNFTWEFVAPNQLKVFASSDMLSAAYFILELEVAHTEFSTIPGKFERWFTDLALADVMDMLGSIRTKYQDFQTPFGTVQLNGDALKNEAEQLRSRVLEKLDTLPPNTHVLVS